MIKPNLDLFGFICTQIQIKSKRIAEATQGAFEHEPPHQELLEEANKLIDAVQNYGCELYNILNPYPSDDLPG